MNKKSKKWVRDIFKALLNPNNIATNVILVILLSILVYFSKPLFLNEINAEIYSNFGSSKTIENNNRTTLYFTFANTGTVPLRIKDILFMWFDYADKDVSDRDIWHYEKITFFDENEEEVTETILLPNEKMKIHIRINKPRDLRSNQQIVQICPFFDATEWAFRGPFNGKLSGTCNKYNNLFWR